MIRFEKKDGQQRIVIELDEYSDSETITMYKEALRGAVCCMSQNNPEVWEKEIYYCLELLGVLSYSIEQEQKIQLCEMLNEDRIKTLRKIAYKTKYTEPLTKEEEEIKRLLF